MRHTVTLLAGEAGESTTHLDNVIRTIDGTGVAIDWQRFWLKDHLLSDDFVAAGKASKNIFMPFLRGLRDQGQPAPIVQARRAFDVYANVRPVRSLPKVEERFHDVDFIVVRETSEDIYTSLEHESVKGMFEGLKVTTAHACERIARFAFERAKQEGRKKVTIVHKANIMKMSDGLFLRTAQKVAEEFPEIQVEDRIVDALCMQLTMWPESFDVVLCANLFGDIVADLGSGLVGGPANCPSVNIAADDVHIYTVGHGDDLTVANSEDGNPLSLLLAGTLLLQHVGEDAAAQRLDRAIMHCLENQIVPRAVGGSHGLKSFCDAVIDALQA